MRFRIAVPLTPFVFWTIPIEAKEKNQGEYTILTSVKVPARTFLFVESYKPASLLQTFFQIGVVGTENYPSLGGKQVGHLFYTDHHFHASGSAIMAYSRVQRDGVNTGDVKVKSTLVMKDATFFVYHSPNLATMISNPKTSVRLHDAITSL